MQVLQELPDTGEMMNLVQHLLEEEKPIWSEAVSNSSWQWGFSSTGESRWGVVLWLACYPPPFFFSIDSEYVKAVA